MKKRKKRKKRSKLTALDLAKIWLLVQILDKTLDLVQRLADWLNKQ